MTELQLRRAGAADVPFIMRTERLPGYDQLVGRWDEARHLQALAEPRYACFIGLIDEAPVGFAIVRDWDSPERVALIQRLAVVEPGRGTGKLLLGAVVDAVFGQTNAHRLAIGTFPENLRARRAYEGSGFIVEGVSRGSAYFHGVHRDELVLAMLRPEWQALRAAGGDPGALP